MTHLNQDLRQDGRIIRNVLMVFTGVMLATGISVNCGDKDEDKDKPKPAVMTVEAQQAAIQEAVTSALPAQLLAPPAMMSPNGYRCNGQISMSYPDPDSDEDPFIIRYSHDCKGK